MIIGHMTDVGPDRACRLGPGPDDPGRNFILLKLQSSAPFMTSGMMLLAVSEVPYP
jgi:hypothetical protein